MKKAACAYLRKLNHETLCRSIIRLLCVYYGAVVAVFSQCGLYKYC